MVKSTSLLSMEDVARLSEARTRQMMDEFAATGRRPQMPPFVSAERRTLAIKAQSNALQMGMELAALCNKLVPGEFIALHIFCDLNDDNTLLLQGVSRELEAKCNAQVLWICGLEGFGDRQPEAGIHIQIMARTFEPPEVNSPFLLRHMRAIADRDLLLEQGFRMLRIDLGASVRTGLERLEQTVREMKTGPEASPDQGYYSWLPPNMPPALHIE